jgi:uncharacterized protein (DUF885 family)
VTSTFERASAPRVILRRFATAFAAMVAASSLAFGAVSLPAATGAGATTTARLAALVDQVWERQKETSPGLRRQLGLPIESLGQVTFAAAQEDAAFAARVLADLQGLEQQALSPVELDSLGVLEDILATTVELTPHYRVLPLLTPYASPLSEVRQIFATLAVDSAAGRAQYLRLLEDFARLTRDLEAETRAQALAGVRIPRPELPAVRARLLSFAGDAGKALFAPDAARLGNGPGSKEFLGRIEAARKLRIEPAVASLVAVLGAEYEALAPAEVGLGRQPGGPAAYRALMRMHTGGVLAPEEIHGIGMAEIARIDTQLEALKPAFGFTGSNAEFRVALRTDPQYFATSAEQIGDRLRTAGARFQPFMPITFAAAPRAAGRVERLAPELEGAMTFGYYDPPRPGRETGVYYFNGSQPEKRSLLFAAPLIFHELLPGHHLQIAGQIENQSLPDFRRHYYSTAYTEGWGEYASALAGELGLYESAWDRAGRLMMEAFISSRLVVDTGMNALGWTRAQAIDFLRAHTFQSDAEIETETLRYSCDIPGQALAYKLGAIEILALREQAKRELGPAFDLREFHQAVLGGGTVPMPVLRQRVQRWMLAKHPVDKAPAQ